MDAPGPQAYLAPLPLGPDPTFVRLSDGFSGRGPTVAADGSRAIFVEFEPVSSSYQSTVVLVDLAESGAVLDRVDVPSGYKPQSARLAGGSGHLLVMAFWEGLGVGDKMLGLGRPTLSGLFPASSDLTADGRLVVGSLVGSAAALRHALRSGRRRPQRLRQWGTPRKMRRSWRSVVRRMAASASGRSRGRSVSAAAVPTTVLTTRLAIMVTSSSLQSPM